MNQIYTLHQSIETDKKKHIIADLLLHTNEIVFRVAINVVYKEKLQTKQLHD